MTASDQLLEPLRAAPSRAAILCDIDGTLAPIVADPATAAVPPEAHEVLAELAGRYRLVACVTGRRALAARRMVGLEQLTYAGNHGLELLLPGDREPRLDPALELRGAAAVDFVGRLDPDELSAHGLRLEDKGPIQAIHWRRAPDPELAADHAASLAKRAAEEGLVPHLGRLVLELRPTAEVHKGIATRRLVANAEVDSAVFGGDDRTDLDAFAALRDLRRSGEIEDGICVGVASAEGPPEIQRDADLVVSGTGAFLDLLRTL